MIGWLSRRPSEVGCDALTRRADGDAGDQAALPDATESRLAACPSSPNCVCSFDDDAQHAIEPFVFDIEAGRAWRILHDVVVRFPRTQIKEQTKVYLWAESRTPLLRYCDDVEFLLDRDAKRIHVRSASRWGYSDLGVNRKRVERLRTAFADAIARDNKRKAATAET